MLVVIRGLKNQKHLLESTKFKFKIQTDYKNLEYFIKAQKLNRKQAHWAPYLSRFNFILKHVLGTKIGKADKLSRRLDQKVSIEKDNENQILIKEQQICNLVEVVIEELEVDIIEKIKIARSKNKKVVKVVKEMKKVGVKVLRENEWQIEGDLVLKEKKVYVLKNETLRVEIIWLYHNMLVVGYREKWKTMELVMRNYQWLEVTKNIGRYIEGYNMY